MEARSSEFKENAARALKEALREQARTIKDHTLAHLDLYLERYEAKVKASGGQVHFAADGAEARRIILDIARRFGARSVAKGTSAISLANR